MAEIWDAYDRQLQIIDKIALIRGEPIPDGMYHLVCDIVVKHTDGTYLLMRRAFEKHCGGMWELTAGGSALQNETPLECAVRELREETGIDSSELQEIGRIVHNAHHSIYVEFMCVTDWDKNAIRLQEGETVDYKWISRAALLELETGALASARTLTLVSELNL